MTCKEEDVILYLNKLNPLNYISAGFHLHIQFSISESESKYYYSKWLELKQKPICENCD